MIIVPIDLEPGFRKADIHNIPAVSIEMVFNFATGRSKQLSANQNDLLVDYVQIRKQADSCELTALVFSASDFANTESHANIALKVMESSESIEDCRCSQCPNTATCKHIITFIFWLHYKTKDRHPTAFVDFWGQELEMLVYAEQSKPIRMRDLVPSDEARLEADLELDETSNIDGQAFLDAVLEDLDSTGARDSALYRQCVEAIDEFEPIFVHHVLLNNVEYNIVDLNSFVQHMETQAQNGLFDNINEVTKNMYKSQLWVEVQYMRIRCSLVHMIVSRKTPQEDEEIFNILFCKGRDQSTEERLQQKQHKRFILKQTEKLEKKEYFECGLLLHESYPYLCAAPDGITDDHIVEIKAPKTEEDFEKYLEARESIAPKYMAQIQIQMFLANVKKALYCVLSPTFDTNGALHYVWVQADPEFVSSLLSMAEDFWKDVVFPRLLNIYPQRLS
ncbi:uncharacterized protein LOC115634209 [Scaptodrosophila lebanonensis]|uniref:Uncharacterized protein LOC115634209 n=1 Tax=Drosophila lebanonensis TaxID=7225 RepID=A0A6J2UGR0_DROLE|nr:uncharacterized protein LOC115634209 [Scaptodrosophila lebanonensis]